MLPRCGACGYAVRGVKTLTCPECGSDLREAGIVTPAQQQIIGPIAFVLLWSVVLLIVTLMLTSIMRHYGARELGLGAVAVCAVAWIGGLVEYFRLQAKAKASIQHHTRIPDDA